MKTSRPVIRSLMHITNSAGAKTPVSVSATVLRDKDDKIIGGVTTLRDLSAIEELKKEITEKYTFEDIVSKSKKVRDLFDILPDIAESDSTVLIEGKSGTGKELFAKAIHNRSPRRKGPFVAVNCAALPETLLESELFGYVRGAFTNALKDKPGRFAVAKGGTIFLDEVAEMSPALQVKLLRVLQEREFEPLGSVRSEKADVRVIVSSNRSLAHEVSQGKFREDLYFRLNIVKIQLPDLKDRKEDIPLLVDHFIKKISAKTRKEIEGVSDEVMDLLMRYEYPGNVRELENLMEHAFVLCRGLYIVPRYLPEEFLNVVGFTSKGEGLNLNELIAAEKRIIEETLIRFNGNKTKAAQALKIGRTTLWRKIKEYKLG
jgi:transcriptional regulator with PAS, ATPase and Fis domain